MAQSIRKEMIMKTIQKKKGIQYYRLYFVWALVFMFSFVPRMATAALQDSLVYVVTGTVTDDRNHPLAHVNVTIPGTHIAVVTNDDGDFMLKSSSRPSHINVSHIGYHPRRVAVPIQQQGAPLIVQLVPSTVVLDDVVIVSSNARDLFYKAMSLIPRNYNSSRELYTCFYRETVQKRQRFINVAEAVAQLYKTPVTMSPGSDRVAIEKGRRLISPRTNDTLGVKILGGPNTPIWLDVVKNHDVILDPEDMRFYNFRLLPPVTLDDRPQYVVELLPSELAPYALFGGKVFIDRETMAFTRAELSLDMRDRDKATRYMLVKKPLGVRFKPREMSITVGYSYDGTCSRINYVRAFFRFNCDWKRRLFSTSFTAQSELVVTDRHTSDFTIPRGRESFYQRDAFFDQVSYFEDPDFWRDYNIIQPTENLEEAIGRLRKANQ